MNKKRTILIISLSLFLLIVIGSILIRTVFLKPEEPTYICSSVAVQQNLADAITNHYQSSTDVHLIAWNNRLYFYALSPINNPYEDSFSVFENGGIQTNGNLKQRHYLGSMGGYVYYSSMGLMSAVYAYELDTQKETFLFTASFNNNDVHFTSDGYVFFPTNEEASSFYVVQGNKVIRQENTELLYQIGDKQYTVREYNNEDLISIDDDEETNMEGSVTNGQKVLLPYKSGLLIYNQGHQDLLYYLDSSGEITLLFSVECMSSVSSICLYKDYIFLSFIRYEKWGEFGMLPFENDALTGTYRIDLRDKSVTKISDSIYSGLYSFGDDAIYATDRAGQIFMIDHDGNVIKELLIY